MANLPLKRHGRIHHELFDEDTAHVGSLGDIVEEHARDALFLTPKVHGPIGADSGYSDFENEILESDPANETDLNPRDTFGLVEDEVWSTDRTGTVAGIARGFGTHLPQDLGQGGFQIEEVPEEALRFRRVPVAPGEELDDYDDDDNTNGKFDPGAKLARASEPGRNRLEMNKDVEPMVGRIPVTKRTPRAADDELEAVREIE